MPSVIGSLRGGFHYFLFRIREGKRESTLNIELPPTKDVVSLRISTFNAVRGESKRNWKRFSRDRGFPNGEGSAYSFGPLAWPLLEFLRDTVPASRRFDLVANNEKY